MCGSSADVSLKRQVLYQKILLYPILLNKLYTTIKERYLHLLKFTEIRTALVRQRERQKKPVLIMLIGLTISAHLS